MKTIVAVVVLGLLSCKSSKNKFSVTKENELRKYFLQKIKEIDSTYSLDSFMLVRIDTLTQRDKYVAMADPVIERMKEINEELEDLVKSYKSNMQLVNLSSGLSAALYNNYKVEADDDKREIDKLGQEGKMLAAKHDSLMGLSRTADSITPVAYQSVSFYQFRRKDGSVKKDTAFIILNKDKNIIKREEFSQ